MVPDALYEELKRVAGEGKTIIYRKAGQLVGLDIESKRDRDQLMAILEEVNRLEHEAGRPLLAAVVVAYIQQVPGAGFFNSAKELGVFRGRTLAQQRAFWAAERTRLRDFWSKSTGSEANT
jgi:hypothetical protein